MKKKVLYIATLIIMLISTVVALKSYNLGHYDTCVYSTIIGVISFIALVFYIAKAYADWVDKNNNGYNPFLGY